MSVSQLISPHLVTAWATIIDATFVDYAILFHYFLVVLGIGFVAQPGLGLVGLLPLGSIPAGVGDRSGVHLRQPRRRRDHGHVGVGRRVRHPDGALLLGRRGPGDAVP